MVVIVIIAITRPFEIVNVHPPFEVSILMSGVPPFVLGELDGRKHSPATCPDNITAAFR
jgi:hypothetical protein